MRVSLRAVFVVVAILCAFLAWVQPQTIQGYREDWYGSRPATCAVCYTAFGRPAFGLRHWRARAVFYSAGENYFHFWAGF